eukprot:TRINITY_DN50616_c0_g1_i1.p1 TRINITY_DN50616_c0_g1~~TRINITY_DN50616_c0_g1_i1.p1  ORF type:complete len:654 (-),score=96.48 TRINITY_DN50616_c0_g1_i1:96-2057(-)
MQSSYASKKSEYAYKPLPTKESGGSNNRLDIDDQEPFDGNHWRCISDPPLAKVTLGGCAELTIRVEDTRNLLAWKRQERDFAIPVNPYLRLFIDDRPANDMVPVHPANLHYEHTCSILNLRSMIRLELIDDDVGDVGFIEISLGDISFDKLIRGWFELRFIEELEKTSVQRYEAHSQMRDEVARTKKHLYRREVYSERLQEANGNMEICVPRPCCSAGYLPDELQHNAGELLIGLKLVQKSKNSFFALALDPPPPQYFRRQDETLDDMPGLNLQGMTDDLFDIKIATVENLLVRCQCLFRYLLSWRSWPLSLGLLLLAVCAGLNPWMSGVLLPLIPVTLLLLCSDDDMRDEMTIGGRNAAFTEEGFKRVASLGSVESMTRYLHRLVEADLQGKVVSQHRLVAIAARCFRHREPIMSLQELRTLLDEDTETCETKDLQAGQLVLVDATRRAVIQQLGNPDPRGHNASNLTVKYEDDGTIEQVVPGRAIVRLTVPRIPLWAIPNNIELQLVKTEQRIGELNQFLQVRLGVLAKIVAWKEPFSIVSMSLVIALVAFSMANALVVFGILEWIVEATGEQQAKWYHIAEELMQVLPGVIARLAYFLFMVSFTIFYIYNAPWFVMGRSMTSIVFHLLLDQRAAPKGWAFFRPDEEDAAS